MNLNVNREDTRVYKDAVRAKITNSTYCCLSVKKDLEHDIIIPKIPI